MTAVILSFIQIINISYHVGRRCTLRILRTLPASKYLRLLPSGGNEKQSNENHTDRWLQKVQKNSSKKPEVNWPVTDFFSQCNQEISLH